jgi:hypothetical protein
MQITRLCVTCHRDPGLPNVGIRKKESTTSMASSNKTVVYVDFGFTSAEQFWAEVVLPAYERFKADASRANAIDASVHAWHVHYWIWHDQNRGEDTRSNPKYDNFTDKLLKGCPELAWIRDVADAGKHRGLSRRSVDVRGVTSETRIIRRRGPPLEGGAGRIGVRRLIWTTPLTISLSDGSTRGFADVLSRVIDDWRAKYFS